MYGDFSRVLEAAAAATRRVLAQQGRLLLDAELNEQGAILLGYLRQLTADLLGPFAGPVHGCGFAIRPMLEDERCTRSGWGGPLLRVRAALPRAGAAPPRR